MRVKKKMIKLIRLQADFKMKKCLTRILNLCLSYKIAETVVTFLIRFD